MPRNRISRPRLLQELSRGLRGKVTLVCADAGYGKSTLVSEFAESAGLQSQWYHLSPADRDVIRLSEALLGCLLQLASVPPENSSILTRTQRTEHPDYPILSEVLLRQAALVGPEPALIILDDYQNIAGASEVDDLLAALIDGSPPPIRFVILSRTIPRFPLARLKARQEVFVLGQAELAFTREETSQFLKDKMGLDLDELVIDQVQDRTEGWAAGIAMVSQSLLFGHQDRVMAVLADPVASSWLVYDYLAEEVFDKQDPVLQDFLLKSSILSVMTAQMCDHLLGGAFSLSALLALEEKHLFTTSLDPARQTFRYHQLFHEFLRQKLHQLESRKTIASLHQRAAELYERRREWEECVHHYLRAGEVVRAAQVVEAIADQFITAGRFNTVEHWLQELPDDLTATRPWLLVIRARLCHMMLKNEESLRLLERALRIFQVEGDQAGQARTLGEMAYIRCQGGQLEQALRQFDVALQVANNLSELKSHHLGSQAITLRDAGKLEQAAKVSRDSLMELESVQDASKRLVGRSRALRILANTQLEMGDLDGALGTATEALHFCASNSIGEYEETWTLIDFGANLSIRGELDQSIELLNRALSKSGRYIRDQQNVIARWLGNSLRAAGRYQEADQAYRWGTGEASLERIFLQVQLGQAAVARPEALELYGQYRESEVVCLRTTAEVVLGAVLRECHAPDKALEHVREAVASLGTHGFRLREVSALLHQARLEFELSRLAAARSSLDRAFGISESHGYFHFYWWDPNVVAYLCQQALAVGIHTSYAVELASRRLVGPDAAQPAPQSGRRSQANRIPSQTRALLSTLWRKEFSNPQKQVLLSCPDTDIRESLSSALDNKLVSAQGLRKLREENQLSWRELQVFVEYYLRPASREFVGSAQLRKECAQRLGVSDSTVRCHVNSLRNKLSLPAWVAGSRVLEWAEKEGYVPAQTQ
jgi:ATP/maltotriose-dependent transcriptional regulator MalT